MSDYPQVVLVVELMLEEVVWSLMHLYQETDYQQVVLVVVLCEAEVFWRSLEYSLAGSVVQ